MKSDKENSKNQKEEDNSVPLLDLNQSSIKKLISQAKTKGYLTYSELNETMPPGEMSSEQIEDIMTALSEMGITLIESDEEQEEKQESESLESEGSKELVAEFYKLMDGFSSNKEFERAAVYRDRISALREIQRSQSITGFIKNRDAIYLSLLKGKPKIGVSSVNQGWVTGHRNYLIEEGFEENEVLENFITHNYLSGSACPPVLLIDQDIENKALIEKALSSFHSKKISIITKPSKKDKNLKKILSLMI